MTEINHPVIVHSLDDARAALAAAAALGCPLTLASAPGAAAYAGAAWFRDLVSQARTAHPSVPVVAVLDCGDQPGLALAALRAGLRHLRCAAPPEAAFRLADIAGQLGATVIADIGPAFDPRGARDPVAACRAWLERDRSAASP